MKKYDHKKCTDHYKEKLKYEKLKYETEYKVYIASRGLSVSGTIILNYVSTWSLLSRISSVSY